MIENGWAWAAQHGKLEKNVVNGAEYANLVVDQVRQKLNERSQSMVATASAQIEAGNRSAATDCMCICVGCRIRVEASWTPWT